MNINMEMLGVMLYSAIVEIFVTLQMYFGLKIVYGIREKRKQLAVICIAKMFCFNLFMTYIGYVQVSMHQNNLLMFFLNIFALVFYFGGLKVVSQLEYFRLLLGNLVIELTSIVACVVPYLLITKSFGIEGTVFTDKTFTHERLLGVLEAMVVMSITVFIGTRLLKRFAGNLYKANIPGRKVLWIIMIFFYSSALWGYAQSDILSGKTISIYYGVVVVSAIVALYEISLWVRKRQEKIIRKENQILTVENAVMKEYYETLQYQVERTRRFRHDIEKHMNVLKEMISEKDNSEQIVNYASQVQDEYSYLRHIAYCENPVINAILVNKKQQCEEQGIEMKIDMPTFNMGNIKEIDMVAILSNLLDVAMNGNKITFQCGERADNLVMQVSYSNSDEKVASEKELAKKLSLTKEIVEKYDGTINVTQDIGKVMVTLVIYKS